MAERQAFELDWREIIDFERGPWRSSAAKQVAIRERFGLSPARYYQLLNRLIDTADALRYDPMLVQRLRRVRDARRVRRFGRAPEPGREGEPR